eukprot:1094811-Rhodomonas_salina.1
MAVRSYSKAARAARDAGMDPKSYTIMNLDMASLQSVRDFVNNLRLLGRPIDALVCNAAVWYPQDKAPRLTVDGFEEVSAGGVRAKVVGRREERGERREEGRGRGAVFKGGLASVLERAGHFVHAVRAWLRLVSS